MPVTYVGVPSCQIRFSKRSGHKSPEKASEARKQEKASATVYVQTAYIRRFAGNGHGLIKCNDVQTVFYGGRKHAVLVLPPSSSRKNQKNFTLRLFSV